MEPQAVTHEASGNMTVTVTDDIDIEGLDDKPDNDKIHRVT